MRILPSERNIRFKEQGSSCVGHDKKGLCTTLASAGYVVVIDKGENRMAGSDVVRDEGKVIETVLELT